MQIMSVTMKITERNKPTDEGGYSWNFEDFLRRNPDSPSSVVEHELFGYTDCYFNCSFKKMLGL